MADERTHPRPDQAEEPIDDVGASNVDLDEARHGATHTSPAVPEPGHEPDQHVVRDDHGHDLYDDAHDDAHDDDHPTEDPKWVVGPLVVGLVIGVVLVIVLGLQSGANPFHQL